MKRGGKGWERKKEDGQRNEEEEGREGGWEGGKEFIDYCDSVNCNTVL